MLNNRISQFRAYNKLEPESIAKVLNIDLDEYLKYESGEAVPDINILTNLATLYKVTLNEFYGHTPRLVLNNEPPVEYTSDEDLEILKFAELSIDEKELIFAYRISNNKEQFFKILENGKK